MMTAMLGGLLTESDKREDYLDKAQFDYDAKESERKAIKEQGILLKAKLIQMRDKAVVSSVAQNLNT